MVECTWVKLHEEMEKCKMEEEMRLKEFLFEEDGLGTIEVVLILVVLIGLVIVFKTQINKLLTSVFTEINKQAKEVY